MLQSQDLTERLEAYYPMLSPKLKLAARYVLDAPDDVALSSMRDVAARAGVLFSMFVLLLLSISTEFIFNKVTSVDTVW